MPHSCIIQLTKTKPEKKESLSVFDIIEDQVFRSHSDWGGVEGSFADNARDIANELRPVCFINQKRRTLTFKSIGTLKKYYVHSMVSTVKKVSASFKDKNGNGEIQTHTRVIDAIETLSGTSKYLFYYGKEGYPPKCHTLSELILDHINGNLPKKIYIGKVILGYHF